MTGKIIQIIPAPAGLVTNHTTGEHDAEGRSIARPERVV
jgi:hypothetical protein